MLRGRLRTTAGSCRWCGNRMGNDLPIICKLQADVTLSCLSAYDRMDRSKEIDDFVAGRLARKEKPDVVALAQGRQQEIVKDVRRAGLVVGRV